MLRTISVLLILAGWMSSCQNRPESTGQAFPAAELALRWEHLGSGPEGGYRARFVLKNNGATPLPSAGWSLYFNQLSGVAEEGQPTDARIEQLSGDWYRLTPTDTFGGIEPGDSAVFVYGGAGHIDKIIAAPDGPYFVFRNEVGEELAPQLPGNYLIAPFPPMPGVPTPASVFNKNKSVSLLPATALPAILPSPAFFTAGSGAVSLTGQWRIHYAPGLEHEARYLADLLGITLQTAPAPIESTEGGATAIRLHTGSVTVSGTARNAGSEAYTLTVDAASGIDITGADNAGVFYGVQSLMQLLPPEAFRQRQSQVTLSEVVVADAPRFGYRGMHLDVARNFQPKANVLRLLDLMAFYKLNRFHFHLTDDEGWRIEIPQLPELTEVGSNRGHTLTENDYLHPAFGSGPFPNAEGSLGNGYYRRADFIEILRYAAERHIEVIPEVDLPGHMRAAIVAMKARQRRLSREGKVPDADQFILHDPQDSSTYKSVQDYDDNVICPCQESTYRFIDTVVSAIVGMFQEAEAPLSMLHIGGDEVPEGVWQNSPACARLIADRPELKSVVDLNYYVLRRCDEMLQRYGLKTAGWEEIALERLPGGGYVPHADFKGGHFIPYVWNNLGDNVDLGNRLANAGYPVILCAATNLYFNQAYNADPEEPGKTWAGLIDTRKVFEFVPEDVLKSSTAHIQGKEAMTPAGMRNILGIQGELWSEILRQTWMMEYGLMPKMLALAERAWSVQPAWARISDRGARESELAQAWNLFANRLGQRELPRLDYLFGGIGYRLPPPGAVIDKGLLQANVDFPGLTIRFTTDGSEPTNASPLYEKPIAVTEQVKLATFDRRGRKSRTVVVE